MHIDWKIGEAVITLEYSRTATSDMYEVWGQQQLVVGYEYELLGVYVMGAGGRRRVHLNPHYYEKAMDFIEEKG